MKGNDLCLLYFLLLLLIWFCLKLQTQCCFEWSSVQKEHHMLFLQRRKLTKEILSKQIVLNMSFFRVSQPLIFADNINLCSAYHCNCSRTSSHPHPHCIITPVGGWRHEHLYHHRKLCRHVSFHKHVTQRNMASTQLPLRPVGGASLENRV